MVHEYAYKTYEYISKLANCQHKTFLFVDFVYTKLSKLDMTMNCLVIANFVACVEDWPESLMRAHKSFGLLSNAENTQERNCKQGKSIFHRSISYDGM